MTETAEALGQNELVTIEEKAAPTTRSPGSRHVLSGDDINCCS
jgi:hypothetical protein